MYVVAVKPDKGDNVDIAYASVEYAFRVLSKRTGKTLYSNTNTWFMKIPDKEGDYEAMRQYYKYEPLYIRTINDIPNENEGVQTYLKYGKKETVGRNILIEALDEHGIRYDLIKERTL